MEAPIRDEVAEWERQADAFALEAHACIDQLERDFLAERVNSPYRRFWEQVRELNERVRVAPAIKLDDKQTLQRRINTLCQQVRQQQKIQHERAAAWQADMLQVLGLAEAGLGGAESIGEIQEIREDLTRIRARLDEDPGTDRRARQQVWDAWQGLNRASWEKLTDLWQHNEEALTALLQQAEQRLEARDARGGRELIKDLQRRLNDEPCSRAASLQLRARARSLWQQSTQVAQEKREKYLAFLTRQIPSWQTAITRSERRRGELEREIGELERLAAAPGTAVGTALLRGQLEDRRRQLTDLLAQQEDLQKKLVNAQSALARGR